ncbi:MAG: hypothetical protein WCK09_05105 [Bacteroidota bacterium]
MYAKLFLLFSCIIMIACSKKETPVYVQCPPIMPSPYRIAEETEYRGPDTTFWYTKKFFYDESGRLVMELTTQDGFTDTTASYTYFTDRVKTPVSDILLNERGLAISAFSGVSYTWSYNAEDFMTTQFFAYAKGSATYSYSYNCSNQDRVITLYGATTGTHSDTTNFQFYTDKPNTIGNLNHGIAFYGKQNNTLIRSQARTGQQVIHYTYYFDDMNRVQWQVLTDTLGNIMYMKYTYQQ